MATPPSIVGPPDPLDDYLREMGITIPAQERGGQFPAPPPLAPPAAQPLYQQPPPHFIGPLPAYAQPPPPHPYQPPPGYYQLPAQAASQPPQEISWNKTRRGRILLRIGVWGATAAGGYALGAVLRQVFRF